MKNNDGSRFNRNRLIMLFITCAVTIAFVFMIFLLRKFYIHEKWQSSQIAELSHQISIIKANDSAEMAIELGAEQSFYQKLQAGLPVNIVIIGDSIGAGAGASDISYAWFNILAGYLKETYDSEAILTNISMGGNASYAGYVRVLSLNSNVDYDLAILCYGQNDSQKDFGVYYESIIRAVKKRWKNCSMISILESSQQDYTEKMKTIESLADYYGILIADTIKPFIDGSNGTYEGLTKDFVHPNDAGQAVYAETVENIIDSEVERTILETEEMAPMNLETDFFENIICYEKDSFERTGNKFTLKIDPEVPVSGIMGIDYTYISGENTCMIMIDDVLFSVLEVSFDYDFYQRRIVNVKSDIDNYITISDKVEISFQTTEEADGFYGICFSWGK